MSDLSLFRPSAAKRWLHCPGSVVLEALAPETAASVYAREGSACHLLSAMRLQGALTAVGLTKSKGKLIREVAPLLDPNEHDYLDIRIDGEMIWMAQVYVIFIESLLPKGISTLDENRVAVEKKIHLPQGLGGTPDAVVIDRPLTLHIVDLKCGVGEQVEAIDNPQLAIYALGALKEYGNDFDSVKMTIFQPRGSGETVRTWEVKPSELQAVWPARITEAIERAKKNKDEFIPGEYCRWCSGAINCPQANEICTEMTIRPVSIVPRTPEELSRILSLEPAVLEFLNACKVAAQALNLKGIEVPGYKLVKTWGREKWIPGKEGDIEKLLNFVSSKPGEYRNTGFRTPKQIRTALGKRYPAELDKLTTTPMLGTKLVPNKDKRPRFSPAAEVFKNE